MPQWVHVLMRGKLWKVREFRRKHGSVFPMLPRKPGLCIYPVVHAGAGFFKNPRRVFVSLFARE